MYDHKVLQEAINDSISFAALLENHLDAGWELIKLEFYTSSGSAFGFAVLRKSKVARTFQPAQGILRKSKVA